MKVLGADSKKQKRRLVLASKGTRAISRFWGIWLVVLTSWGCMIWGGGALGADTDPATENFVAHIMATQEQLANINRRIEKEKFLAVQGPAPEQTARNRNVTRLQEIKFIHQRLLNTLKKNISLASEDADLRKAIESGQAYVLAQKKPYSLSYYDKLLDKVAGVQQEMDVLKTSMSSAEGKLDESRRAQEKVEQTWRRIKEEVTEKKGAAAKNDLQYTQAQLERDAAQAVLELQAARRDGNKMELRLVDLKQKGAQQKLAMIRKDLSFDPAALDREISRLGKQKNQLSARLQSVLDEQKKVELDWQADRTTASSSATESALKAREAWRDAYEKILQQTEEMTQLLSTQEKLWKLRYTLVKGDVPTKDLDRLEQTATAARQHTQQAVGLYQTWQVNLQSRIASLLKDRGGVDPTDEKYATHQLNALNKTGEFGGEYLSTLLVTGQLAGRLLDEIASRGKQISLWEKTLSTGSKFNEFWNFELWAIDDNGVTIRKVFTALVILILGIMVVKRAISVLSMRLKKSKLEASAAGAAEKLLLYTGFVMIVLFALRTVNIPLTAFTFLGGAIAIGLGFGAQNLINNFISGFIIMAERPIRIGDLIEVEDKCGRVEEIGARCTRVKTGENIHILVPNSSFLEKSITNWTLSDKMFRNRVAVGVAYGAPVKQVSELLLQAADQTERVLKDPQPFVVFDDFGDNALTFEIYFWVIIRSVIEKKRIASDLRYQINALLSMHDISIAFPQRDIHVDSLRPLQVQVLTPRRDEKS